MLLIFQPGADFIRHESGSLGDGATLTTLDLAGMSGVGKQSPSNGKMQREPAQAVPAGQTPAGVDCIVKKCHVSLHPP